MSELQIGKKKIGNGRFVLDGTLALNDAFLTEL